MLAIGGISLAFIIAQTTPALAAMDRDNDGLSNSLERNVTPTNPRDKDSDDDLITDGIEDEDEDGEQDGDDDGLLDDGDCDDEDEGDDH